MKDQLNIIVFVAVLALLYSSFFLEILGPVFNPNLILAFLLAYEMRNKIESSVMAAFYSGVVVDLFLNNSMLGMSSIFFIGAMYVAYYTKKFLIRTKLINFLYAGVFQILYLMLFSAAAPQSARDLVASSVMTVIASLAASHLFNKFNLFSNSKSIKMNRL